MYKISINEDLSVLNIYNTDYHVDNGVTLFNISDIDAEKIIASGNNSLWQYKNNQVVESEFAPEILRQEFNASQRQKRELAYKTESDPINFMYQRGEATQQQWLDKIAEIKARFPYQD